MGGPAPARILVADDEPPVREMLKVILESDGYVVETAADGDEAWSKVRSFTPDLILTDVMMPRLNGYDLCRRVRSGRDTWRIPVVMVTALGATEDRIAGIEAGADDFLRKPPSKMELLARVRSLLKIKFLGDSLEEAENVIASLALAVEAKDRYTEGHTERVSAYAAALGRAVGLSDETLDALRRGGVLHDIGKIGTPESILNKPGALTPEEFETIRAHAAAGHAICKPLRALVPVVPMIRWHHEKLDGSGYPDGLRGDQIPVPVRIITIADIYDALRTRRPYKPAFTQEVALDLMDQEVKGGKLDGDLMRIFTRHVLPVFDAANVTKPLGASDKGGADSPRAERNRENG